MPHPSGRGRVPFTILESAVHTEEAAALSDVFDLGEFQWLQVLLSVTAAATQNADKLDIILEGSPDNAIWYQMGAYPQVNGDDSTPAAYVMTFEEDENVDPDSTFTLISSPGVVNQTMMFRFLRANVTVTRANGADESFTFSLKAYIAFDKVELPE
jgi:hypothetical protein